MILQKAESFIGILQTKMKLKTSIREKLLIFGTIVLVTVFYTVAQVLKSDKPADREFEF